jgi:hypothetical protein
MLGKLTVRALAGASCALLASIAIPEAGGAQLTTEVRGGSSIPAGAIDDIVDGGAFLGLGLGYTVGSRFTLRADGDWEMLNEQNVGNVTMPRTFLWHLQGGAEVDVTNPETSMWLLRLRGGAGATVYDTDRFTAGSDDFVETFFSTSAGVSLGHKVTESLEVGGFGKFNVVFTDKDDLREISNMNPGLVHPFSRGSTFPLGLYIRWRGLTPEG